VWWGDDHGYNPGEDNEEQKHGVEWALSEKKAHCHNAYHQTVLCSPKKHVLTLQDIKKSVPCKSLPAVSPYPAPRTLLRVEVLLIPKNPQRMCRHHRFQSIDEGWVSPVFQDVPPAGNTYTQVIPPD